MGSFVLCCSLFYGLLTFNLRDTLNPVFAHPITYIKSLFNSNPLPVQTRDTKGYTLVLVGDSMTEVLGTADPLREALKDYYPEKEFGILNFSIGSTSILSVPARLKMEAKRQTETLPAVLDTKPDIIFLESFGNNPLSQYPLNEGLKKQTETLKKIVEIIKENNPETVLVFTATIAPSKDRYAEGIVDLLPAQREKWAEERIAYIKNHIEFAESHNIPLINTFEKSLTKEGNGSPQYLDGNFIHPSAAGMQLISQHIADYIFINKIIPTTGI
ncbi:MAG: SGNH/GDSL hydrolase family protein [Candidatus Daviesbacteria bacterium]|nr:SGNH/GDSL hydrolase family protein [Candidatus Daviesbacteria bacterium]